MAEQSLPSPSAAPPPPRAMTDQIRKMAPGDSISFDGPSTSVRATVSRISAEYKGRQYQTARDGNGTRVWRLK